MIKVNKFFVPYLILLIVIGFRGELLISFLVVMLHEAVHYFTAVCFGFSGFDMKILPIGTVLRLKDLDEASPKEDLIISLAGPVSNFLLALTAYFINIGVNEPHINLFINSNLALGLFNLMPAFPLDGGRIMRDILNLRTIYRRANELTIKISIVTGFLMIGCFIFFALLGSVNYNMGVIGAFVVISSYKEKERIAYIIMGDIIKKKIKFLNRKYIENKSISVYYKADLIGVLSLVDKNKYSIFTVLDDNMKVMDIIYEEEILEALKDYGNITIEEFVVIRDGGSLME